MRFEAFSQSALPLVERAMLDVLASSRTAATEPLHEMLVYHLGLDAAAGPAQGKRIRPLLVLLCCGSVDTASDGWLRALPSAAAVELLHNFSLIHDDIQDASAARRGRPSVWARWGIPQAINAGDAMYTLAYRALFAQHERSGPGLALEAQSVFQDTCLALTRGQFLDLDFETRSEISLEDYWEMIGGKTAALLAACAELGALAAGTHGARRIAYREFGRCLGLAFQAQDDLLGIWGDEALTGKSSAGDLVSGKKSLPILFGLAHDGEFARRWREGAVDPESAAAMADLLAAEGGREFTEEHVHAKTGEAMQLLEEASPEGEMGELLVYLANSLLGRQG